MGASVAAVVKHRRRCLVAAVVVVVGVVGVGGGDSCALRGSRYSEGVGRSDSTVSVPDEISVSRIVSSRAGVGVRNGKSRCVSGAVV